MQLKPSRTLDDFQGSQSATGWRSFEIVRGAPETSLLILCDHATNLLPPQYGTLGLDESELNRHIGYDIGAEAVALEIGRRAQATVISSRFSRLLIDPNRGPDDPTLVMSLSDGATIPGNVAADSDEIAARIENYYVPYHAAISHELDAMAERGLVPVIFSVHSFTHVWRGVLRKWHSGVLWDKDPRLAMPLLHELEARTGLEVGDNEPYSGRLRGNTLYQHGTLRGLPHALIEVRQDLIQDEQGQLAWGALLAECLASIFANPEYAPALSRVDYFGSCTDIHQGERHSL